MCRRLQILIPEGVSTKVPFTLSKPEEEEQHQRRLQPRLQQQALQQKTDVPTTTT